MKRTKRPSTRPVAKELSPADAEKMLQKIGKAIKSRRQDRTTLESFSYEINVSRSAMTKYEAGGDMYLSTFLKLLHGLDIAPEDFFKRL